MQIDKKTEVIVVLTLNQKETKWLNDYMRNAMVPIEGKYDAEMRAAFFNATIEVKNAS